MLSGKFEHAGKLDVADLLLSGLIQERILFIQLGLRMTSIVL